MGETVLELFLKGGGFMWPLLALSVLSLVVIVERSWYFFRSRYRVGASLEALEKHRDGASLEAGGNPLLIVGETFIAAASQGEEHAQNVSEREANRRINRHERGLRLLALIGAISPLIGLLGTVWGMVKAFAEIAVLGESVTPADFADGIWTGLLTTVAGLLVAIPAVAASRLFEGRVDQMGHDLNEVVSFLNEWFFSKENF